ncbi:MAG TPA: glycoside hydrolase family 16 protein [Solirubrobacteraceae bacterium]
MTTALAAAALIAAATVPALAGALPLAPLSPASVRHQPNQAGQEATSQHRARVGASGVYRIRVAVTTRRIGARLVNVRIGHLHRQVWVEGARRSATIVVVEALSHHWLLVRATSKREAPLLSVALKRVSTQTVVTAPASKPKTRATGATGTTGDTGATGATGTTPPPAVAPPAPPLQPRDPSLGPWGDPGSWHLAFDDEFNGTSLNTAVWNTGWLSSGLTGPIDPDELECYSPSQDVVANGELDLNLIAQPVSGCVVNGGPQTISANYESGMVNTRDKFSYTYGFLEARVWLPGTPWAGVDWPGVWEVGNPAPQNGEIDLIEGLGGQACYHYHDPTGAPFGSCLGGWDGTWHTFGVDWEPGSVTWYFDGGPAGEVTSAQADITGAPMYLIADLALDNSSGGPISAPATMKVDYIRVWQH